MQRHAWLVVAAVLLLAVPGLAQRDPKLDPEAPAGVPPFNEAQIESYTTGMLIGYLDSYSRAADAASQARATRIFSHLSQTDPNWRVSAATAGASLRARAKTVRSRRLKKTDTGAQATASTGTATAAVPPVVTAPVPPPERVASVAALPPPAAATTATEPAQVPVPVPVAEEPAVVEQPPVVPAATTVATPPAAKPDWFRAAQDQMQSFWEADRDTLGAAPKGKIYNPMTGELVSVAEHTARVGVGDAFSDELSNTSSGQGAGTMKRITDR